MLINGNYHPKDLNFFLFSFPDDFKVGEKIQTFLINIQDLLVNTNVQKEMFTISI